MAISMGLMAAISLLIKGFDKLVNAQVNAIEKADEAISKFNEQREALSSNKKTIDEISADYENLSKGVDSLGRNISLNTDEYNRYNDIVNQIADMFPQMVLGYTDEEQVSEFLNNLSNSDYEFNYVQFKSSQLFYF